MYHKISGFQSVVDYRAGGERVGAGAQHAGVAGLGAPGRGGARQPVEVAPVIFSSPSLFNPLVFIDVSFVSDIWYLLATRNKIFLVNKLI